MYDCTSLCDPHCTMYIRRTYHTSLSQRDKRERWPLLTVEAAVNGDSKSTNERGPSLVGSLGLSCRYHRFLFCLGCSSQPSMKYFSLRWTLFHFLCPHRPASWIHRKKRLTTFTSPARMSLTKLSLSRNNLIIPAPGKFGK